MPDSVKADTEAEKAKSVLMTFAQYGFQKTSMEDIGRAAGVSRQSIYKKFGSKDKCYEWVIHTYLSDMYTRVFAALDNDDVSPLKTLVDVMNALIGEAIEIVSNAHGTALLDDALKMTHASQEDWPLRLRARMADFLERHNLAPAEKSKGVAFALVSAGKGLLLEESSREQFLEDITMIIKSIVNYEI